MKTLYSTVALTLFLSFFARAYAEPQVFVHSVEKPLSAVYDKLVGSLEEARLYVVLEPDIGRNLSGFAERWGDDYNRNKLDAIRGLVFCNGWYANQVSNKDPHMLALCPLSITLIEKDGATTALFARPSVIAGDSLAKDVIVELEEHVIATIRHGMN